MNRKYLISRILVIVFGTSIVLLFLEFQNPAVRNIPIWILATICMLNFIGFAVSAIFYIWQRSLKNARDSKDHDDFMNKP